MRDGYDMSIDAEAAERGAELQAQRQSRALDEPDSPVARFIDQAPDLLGIDWDAPNEFPRAQRQVPMLITGAQRNRARAPRLAPGHWAVLSGGEVVGGFDALMTSLPSAIGLRVARSRALTHAYLTHAGLPTPRTHSLGLGDADAARTVAAEFSRAVVKPATGRRGRGVSTGVRADSSSQVDAAFAFAAAHLWTRPEHDPRVLVQEHHEGLSIRVLVVAEQVVSAVARLPLHVLGDGESTLSQLTGRAAQRRSAHAFLSRFPVTLDDDTLALMGQDADEVPPSGASRVVSASDNPLSGGVTVDVTEAMCQDLHTLAVEAVWSLPDVKVAGVDLIVPDLDTAAGAVVTEFREDPVLGLHGFPLYGRSRPTATPVMETLIARAAG